MGQHQRQETCRGSNVHYKVSVSFPFLLGMCARAKSASSSVASSGGRHVAGRNRIFPPFCGEDDESNSPQGSSTKAWENEVCKNPIDLRLGGWPAVYRWRWMSDIWVEGQPRLDEATALSCVRKSSGGGGGNSPLVTRQVATGDI